MDIAIFFYNILIMSAFIFCCVIFFVLYTKYRQRCQLYISLMFLLFITDNLVLYMIEFLPVFSNYYEIVVAPEPYITNFLWLAIVFCYRAIFCSLRDEEMRMSEKLMWIGLLLLIFASTALYGISVFKYVVLFSRHGTAIGVFAFALHKTLKERKMGLRCQAEHLAVPKISPAFIIASLVLQITATIEGFAEIFGHVSLIEGRSLSIEFISILYSFSAVWFLVPLLVSSPATEEKSTVLAAGDNNMLGDFCDKFELTRRERDVLNLLVQGLSNADISSKIYISEGTVKAHVHNIYTKLGVRSRLQLLSKLSDYKKSDL